jgi:demethylmenaquinone methyltransferase/2-methoxy-6-polyprenyl-1,4-benzoquinol methylase
MTHQAADPSSKQAQSAPPAWSDSDLADNPHDREDKPSRVRAMFGAIAQKYDLNNRLHSFWQDEAWRRRAVRIAQPQPTDRVLDVACGTGDLTRAFTKAGVNDIVGLDFTPEMLVIAREKVGGVQFIQGDAMDLPFEDASFDVLSIAFGIRNVADPAKALAEFRRVLRPAGRLVILEFTDPPFAPVRFCNNIYTRHIMPFTATLISGDTSGAYKYLPRSVATFYTRDQMFAAITAAGFSDAKSTDLTLGVCACYRAVVVQ